MDTQQQHTCVECSKNELRTKKCPTMYLQASMLLAGMADAKLEERGDNHIPAVHFWRGNPRQGESENVDGNTRLVLDPLV